MKKSKRLKRPYLKNSPLKRSDKASSFKGLLKKEDNVISLENFKPKESERFIRKFFQQKRHARIARAFKPIYFAKLQGGKGV
ncbi:hypothetical protein ATCC49503_13500 [Helicobacter pylori]|nr:hypothetical protein ATCC49503_13500 [Helicobacter pylori]